MLSDEPELTNATHHTHETVHTLVDGDCELACSSSSSFT